jgi:hypothetical protein
VQIPPPGSDPSAIAEYVDLLVREHAQDQHRMAWAEQAERGLNLYLGNHYTTPEPADAIRIVLNRTLTVVISQVAIQAGDPPAFTFKRRETGDKPVVHLNTNLPEGLIASSFRPSLRASKSIESSAASAPALYNPAR